VYRICQKNCRIDHQLGAQRTRNKRLAPAASASQIGHQQSTDKGAHTQKDSKAKKGATGSRGRSKEEWTDV